MSFFSNKPSQYDAEVTIGNICAMLNDTKYTDGLDPTTTVNMIADIYNYFMCSKNIRIRLPAPIADPDDSYCFMWPEGAKISSRAPSNASTLHNGRKFTNYNSEKARNRASSVVSSSKFSTRHVGFAEDDDSVKTTAKSQKYTSSHHKSSSSRQRRPSTATSTSNESHILRVNGQVMRPTPSMEQVFSGSSLHADENDNKSESDKDDVVAPPALRRQAKFSGFAEDDE